MPRKRSESLATVLLVAPWWVSATLGVIAFVVFKWGVPRWAETNQIAQVLSLGSDKIAALLAVVFGLLALSSALFAHKRRRLVDDQSNLESLRATSWKDFEYLVAEAYRRLGYSVSLNTGQGADGGVDLELRREGRLTLVQCKQWKAFKIGAPVVRELLGAITATKADAGIVITTGKFTRDAIAFAAGNAIQLIDGPGVLNLVRSVQSEPVPKSEIEPSRLASPHIEASSSAELVCPLCSSPMVKRTARRGANAGQEFWGCSTYPNCRGTRPI